MQPIIQGFYTTADLDGIKKMSAGMKQVRGDMAQLDVQAARSSNNFETAFKKLERPLGREVFRSIAMEATGAATSMTTMQSGAQAATLGLETLGRGALMFTGPLGMAVLGVVALISIFSKLSDAQKLTVDGILQSVDKLKTQSDQYKQSADNLLKLNLITEKEADTLRHSSQAKKEDIEKIREHVRERIKGAELRIVELKGLEEHRRKLGLESVQLKEVAEAEKEYARAVELSAGFLNQSNSVLEEQRKKAEMMAEAYKLETSAMLQSMVKNGQYQEVLQKQIDIKKQLAEATDQLTIALMTGDEKAADSARKLVEELNSSSEALGTAGDQMKQKISSLANEIVKFANISASAWEYKNDRLVFSTEKAGAELIKITGDYLTKMIAMEAAEAFASGNFIKGAALTAAAGVVATISGAASAYLEHEDSRSSNSPSGSKNANSPSSSGGGNMMNLYVKIEGGYFDDRAADNLAKRLSERVQRANVRLVSSTVNPPFGTSP